MKQQELLLRGRCIENRDRIVNELTETNLKDFLLQNEEYLEAIVNGEAESWRQSVYSTPGSEVRLGQHWIGEPFTDDQFYFVGKTLKEMYKDTKHIQAVLFPEMLIKIYRDFLQIPGIREAENMIKNPGSLRKGVFPLYVPERNFE